MIKKKNVYLMAICMFAAYLAVEVGSSAIGIFESVSHLMSQRISSVALTLIGICVSIWLSKSESFKGKQIPSYDETRKACIADMEHLIKEDGSFRYNTGYRSYTADQLKYELENETPFGKEYIENCIQGIKFFREK